MFTAVWQGSEEEFDRLARAVNRNCTCDTVVEDQSSAVCAPHQMLEAQSILDHLLYVYRVRRMFITREMYAVPKTVRPRLPRHGG